MPVGAAVLAFIVALTVLALYASETPGVYAVQPDARVYFVEHGGDLKQPLPVGYVTTETMIRIMHAILHGPCGYLTNDIAPPFVFLDDRPSWEYGALVTERDAVRVLRNDISRSQSQSISDPDLAKVDSLFNFDNTSWIFPSTEKEYGRGIVHLERYLSGLADTDNANTQFYARADNLSAWLGVISMRLGGLSQRLSASVGQVRQNTDLAGDSAARSSTQLPSQALVKTPWLQVDNVFYEARGSSWALIELLRAIQIDFRPVLQKKNAVVLVGQIIQDLEGTQAPIASPMILNGSDGFGWMPNYSLVMSGYIARANAAVINLQQLLNNG